MTKGQWHRQQTMGLAEAMRNVVEKFNAALPVIIEQHVKAIEAMGASVMAMAPGKDTKDA